MNSQLIMAIGRYKEHVLYHTPCGEYVDAVEICNDICNDCCDCIAGENFLNEIGVPH